ncbi:hypothetical protein NB689_001433 [Xanthomonas sacchari]|nr:hypothetical protein [Xanthomonas sacchari]
MYTRRTPSTVAVPWLGAVAMAMLSMLPVSLPVTSRVSGVSTSVAPVSFAATGAGTAEAMVRV